MVPASPLVKRPAFWSVSTSFTKAFSWPHAALELPRCSESLAAFSLASRLFLWPAFTPDTPWTKVMSFASAASGVNTVTAVVADPATPSSSLTVSVTV